MSDRHIEKSFLYLLALSVLLHLGAWGLLSLIPPAQAPKRKVTMVDLTDLPELPKIEIPKPKPPPPPKEKPKPLPKPVPPPVPAKRLPAVPQDVFTGTASKGSNVKADDRPVKDVESKRSSNTPAKTGTDQQEPPSAGKTDSVFRTAEKGGREAVRGSEKIELSKLFPSARTMTNLEESYRRKYRGSEQGDTRMIDTDDPLVGIYSERMLVAANNSLALESRKTPVRERGTFIGVIMVTLNREGTIEKVEMLESTRSAAIDQLFIDSIYRAGYVGPLPKKWPHDKLKLIWITISQGSAEMAP